MKKGDLVEVLSLDVYYGAQGVVTRVGTDWRQTVTVFFPETGKERGYPSLDLLKK